MAELTSPPPFTRSLFRHQRRGRVGCFFVVELVIALNAYGGAWWGLAGAKDVPREWPEGTPFQSYVIPSLILLVFVGGGMTAAAAALLLRYRHAAEVSIVAGLILVGWIAAGAADRP